MSAHKVAAVLVEDPLTLLTCVANFRGYMVVRRTYRTDTPNSFHRAAQADLRVRVAAGKKPTHKALLGRPVFVCTDWLLEHLDQVPVMFHEELRLHYILVRYADCTHLIPHDQRTPLCEGCWRPIDEHHVA